MEPGFLVKSPCGREWFVPIEAVSNDYAEFLVQADGLTMSAATIQAEKGKDFLPTWFAEQCNMWSDIDRLGRLTKKSSMYKTKSALNRFRGSYGNHIRDYVEIGLDQSSI